MNVLVGIATYQRPEKLKRLLRSLQIQTYRDFKTVIVFDNRDMESAQEIAGYDNSAEIIVSQTHGYVTGCWNEIHKTRGFDAHLMLCDDVELFPDCIERAVGELKSRFADLDGVIGLTQECPGRADYTYKPFGQTLMGSKFIERYASVNYQVCCPDYYHFFQDEEMWQFMSTLRKTYHSPDAKLYHYHPAYKPEELDSTHTIVRVPKLFQRDTETFKLRQAGQHLWGRNFSLINQGSIR